jgi:hypothetical protein
LMLLNGTRTGFFDKQQLVLSSGPAISASTRLQVYLVV